MDKILEKENRILKVLTISISALLLLASLPQITYYTTVEESLGSYGIGAFLLGFCAIYSSGISWLANPFLIVSWYFLKIGKIKQSLVFSVLAVIFSLSFMLFTEVIVNEGGGKREIIAYGIGYWLWISSCGINLIGQLMLYKKLLLTAVLQNRSNSSYGN